MRQIVKVIKNGTGPSEDATNAPLFVGGRVTRRPLVGREVSDYFNFGLVSFAAGARNKFHAHTSDQVLYITSGKGLVTTDAEQVEVGEGDTVLIPKGEKHWHGATAGSGFTHISLQSADSTTEQLEP